MLDLVLRLVYASCIQVGNQARSEPWQKVARTVSAAAAASVSTSAAAASISTSAAAQRDAAAVSFPAAHGLSVYQMLLGCAWALQGRDTSQQLTSGTAGGKVIGSASCFRPSEIFLGQEAVEQHPGVCSLLFNFVRTGSSTRNCKFSQCWSRE